MKNKYDSYVNFKLKIEEATKMLVDIQQFVQEARELEVAVPSTVNKKIKDVIDMLDNKKLRIAFIGGFSEGKTSIVAAWLGKYDKETMKINVQESSDEIRVYDTDNKYEIIDTPGLFGYKEKITDSGKIEKYMEITRKYISEAHIVVYVMDPTNPIKESHRDELKWLFRTLNLLPRTVFVINKFDDVVDIEDDEEYDEMLSVKKETIIERLKSCINLTLEEEKLIPIVGISANPYGEGIEYWLENSDEFERISRVKFLREAIAETIERKGGYFPIVYEMQKSIIKDVLIIRQDDFKEELKNFQLVMDGLKNAKDRTDKDLIEIEEEINTAKEGLRKFFISYFSELVNKIRTCNPEDVQEFIDNEIGKEGCIIDSRIQTEIEKRLSQVNARIEVTIGNFQASMHQQESIYELMGKDGAKYLLKQTFNNKNILFLRDGIVKLGNIVGADLGKILKFKPWGAVNFANKINGVLAIAGSLLEIFELYKERKEMEKFNKELEDMANKFRDCQKQMLELLNDDFEEKFFQNYVELTKTISQLDNEIKLMEDKWNRLNNWYEKGKNLVDKYYEMG